MPRQFACCESRSTNEGPPRIHSELAHYANEKSASRYPRRPHLAHVFFLFNYSKRREVNVPDSVASQNEIAESSVFPSVPPPQVTVALLGSDGSPRRSGVAAWRHRLLPSTTYTQADMLSLVHDVECTIDARELDPRGIYISHFVWLLNH